MFLPLILVAQLGVGSQGSAAPSPALQPPTLPLGFLALNFIKNQCTLLQDPACFLIGRTLSNGQAQGEMRFRNLNDSDGTTGLRVLGDTVMTNKGSQIGVRAQTSMDSFAGQKGATDARVAEHSAFFAQGVLRSVSGHTTVDTLSNFDGTKTSHGLGGGFFGGPSSSISLNGIGNYWVGGVYGEARGTVNGSPGGGAVAGVIGVDNVDPLSTAPHYAGYFVGDVLSTTGMFVSSSIRFKENVRELDGALDKVHDLRGVRYTLKSTGQEEVGVIAEEVAAVLPELVHFESDGVTPAAVDYSRLSAVLVEAVKEQQKQIETLTARIVRMEEATKE